MTRTGPEEGCTWTVPKFSTHVTLAYLPLGTRTQPEGCPLLCLRWEHSVLEAQVWEEVCVIGSVGRAVVGVRHCPFVGCLSQNGSCFGGPPTSRSVESQALPSPSPSPALLGLDLG